MILGFDFGNENIKTSEDFIVKSLFTQTEGLFNYEHELLINGQKYIIGEGNYDTELNKALKPNLLPALCVGLANSTNQNNVDLVVGLPIGQYKAHKDELQKTILGYKTIEFTYNDKQYKYRINKVLVYPEGLGAFANLKKIDRQKFNNTKMIILDIGGRTTEIALLSEDKSRKILKHKSLAIGMINIYSDIITILNEKYTLNLKIEDAETIIKFGLKIYGKPVETESIVSGVLQNIFNEITQELNVNFSADIYPIFLTGGGGRKFFAPLKKKYNSVILSEEFLFANAKGFKKYGQKMWREE